MMRPSNNKEKKSHIKIDIPIPLALSLEIIEHKKANDVNITDIIQPIIIRMMPIKFGL